MLINKQISLFFLSLFISCLVFALFVFFFPFPHENKAEIYRKFVPWVATRTSLYTPYKYWWPIALGAIPGATFVLWYGLCYLWGSPLLQKTYWRYSREELPLFSALEIGTVSFLILFLLVNFSYSSFYQFFYNYHHLNFIAGPINDVLGGKYLLVNTKAQYGFLNILLASVIFKYILYFSHANIHFLSMVLGCIEYLSIYMILRLLTRNTIYSIAGLFFITAVHFYGVFGFLFPSELYVWPGGSVWRFFPAMPTFFFLLLWLKTQKNIWFFITQIGVIIGILWNIEAGVPLLLAYIAVLILRFWYSKRLWYYRLIDIAKAVISLVILYKAFLVGYSIYTFQAVGQSPHWPDLYYFTTLFNSGFLQNRNGAPLPGLAYWPVLLYALSIFLTMTRKYARDGLPVKDLVFLSALSVYGYGIYRYYIGKQSSSDLAAVVVPAGIIFMYFFYQVTQRMLLVRVKKEYLVAGLIMLSFFAYQQGRFVYWTVRLFAARYRELKTITTDPNVNHPSRNHIIAIENTVVNTIPWREVETTIKKIEKYIPAHKPIAFLGYFDHIILMESGRINIADYWYIHTTMYTNEEVEAVEKKYLKEATYLFVDKRLLRNNPTEYVVAQLPIGEQVMLEIFRKLRPKYEFKEDIGMVYVYKRK